MFRNIKIGTKILSVILLVSILTLVIISTISYTQMLNLAKYSQDANIQLGVTASDQSKEALLNQANEQLEYLAAAQAEKANQMLRQIHMDIEMLAGYMETLYANPEQFTGKKVPFIPDAPNDTVSPKYMFAPDVSPSAKLREELRWISSAEYPFSGIFKNNSMLDNIYLATESGIFYRYSRLNNYNPEYDGRKRPWYVKAMKNKGTAIWIPPYIASFTPQLVVSCAKTFQDREGNYAGVIGIDIIITHIVEEILALRIGGEGYAFLLDASGSYIAHPRYEEAGFNPNPLDGASGLWRNALLDMVGGKGGTYIVTIDGSEEYLFSAPIQETGWMLCIAIPVQDVIAPALATQAKMERFTDEAQIYIRRTLSGVLMRFIIIFSVIAMLVVAFSYILSITITRPLEKLSRDVRHIGDGELDTRIEVKGKDEIAELGAAFNKMTSDIRNYIENLKQATAEKERINSELQVANEIQRDMLPHLFPHFTGNEYFAAYGKMIPAKEVGGDFFDIFFLDARKTKIACVIADVCGKGVPSALFMVVAKTLLKQQLLQTENLGEALGQVNKTLCEDNPMCMFVTVFVFVLDMVSGEMRYVNGGHNPPLLLQNGKLFQFMQLKRGIALGALEDSVYIQDSLALNPGDKIYLYTDGVNEAMNEQDELFGNDRFLNSANIYSDMPPEEFDKSLRADIAVFTNGVDQSDDITTLSFHYLKKIDS